MCLWSMADTNERQALLSEPKEYVMPAKLCGAHFIFADCTFRMIIFVKETYRTRMQTYAFWTFQRVACVFL